MSVHFFCICVYLLCVLPMSKVALLPDLCPVVNNGQYFFLLIHTYHPSISILLNFSYFSTIKLHAKHSSVAGLGYDEGLNTSEC